MTIAISAARTAQIAGQEDNPFFAWDNAAASATLGGTAVLADGARENALTGTTFDYWLPDVTTTTAAFEVEFASARSVAFAGIAAHNLADFGASARIQRSADGISWSDAGAGLVTPADNRPIGWRMVDTGQDYAFWRLYVTGLTAGDALAAGVIFFGDELLSPERFYAGFAPVLTPTEIAGQVNVSQGGNLVGTSIQRRGSTMEFSIEHLQSSFVRGASWLAFQRAWNEYKPAFFGWRPDTYPGDLHYLWRDGQVIRPVNSGPKARMGVSVSARVYEG